MISLEAPGRPCPPTHVRTAKGHGPFFPFHFLLLFFFFVLFSLFYDFNFLKPIIYFYTFIPLFAFPTILFPF